MVLQRTAGVSPSKIAALEAAVLAQPQVELEQFHHFDGGVYQRGLLLPAGVVATGAIHLHKNLITLVKGECLFVGDGEPVHAVAPFASVNGPGTKRAVYAITDCVLISYVETELTDPAAVRAAVTVDTNEEYLLLQGTQS